MRDLFFLAGKGVAPFLEEKCRPGFAGGNFEFVKFLLDNFCKEK
jgi:hypothetical protein